MLVVLNRLNLIEAKLDMIQHDICGDATVTRLGFLDAKRTRITKKLARFRKSRRFSELVSFGVDFGGARKTKSDQT